jgi:hypothetical protein
MELTAQAPAQQVPEGMGHHLDANYGPRKGMQVVQIVERKKLAEVRTMQRACMVSVCYFNMHVLVYRFYYLRKVNNYREREKKTKENESEITMKTTKRGGGKERHTAEVVSLGEKE